MTHEARRGLRTAIGVAHILGQLILLYLAAEKEAALKFIKPDEIPASIHVMVGYLAFMLGLYFIYYTGFKLLSHNSGNYSHR
jgi:hypothetical protein